MKLFIEISVSTLLCPRRFNVHLEIGNRSEPIFVFQYLCFYIAVGRYERLREILLIKLTKRSFPIF